MWQNNVSRSRAVLSCLILGPGVIRAGGTDLMFKSSVQERRYLWAVGSTLLGLHIKNKLVP
jgi:hypothetical protein